MKKRWSVGSTLVHVLVVLTYQNKSETLMLCLIAFVSIMIEIMKRNFVHPIGRKPLTIKKSYVFTFAFTFLYGNSNLT